MTTTNESAAAMAMVKAVYDDQEMEINERSYKFVKMNHKKRRKVFAFMSRVQPMIAIKDFSFIDWPDFEAVEAVIHDHVTFNDSLISKIPTHWDVYPEDYVNFTLTALPVISFPFLGVSRTD